jgi:O-antigen/teichoic acid export membrane protein
MQTANKTIAKNTVFLYFRMMFTMIISLYTSRVILQVLGVDDYGLYVVVGGVVGMLSFLNNALSTGSSRFLTFELGTGDFEKLRKTFSTVLNIHIAMAIVIVLLAETIGLWFVYHKLAIPADRMTAALWVYHLSVLTAVFSITQVPYNASIISHEKMNVFAYAGIVEVSAKLGLVYLLQAGHFDKLILYAILIGLLQVCMALFYRFYCISRFKETHYTFVLDKDILQSVAGFSGWSLFAGASIALNGQGTTIITNVFFGPAVVTARAIAGQVNMAASQFMQNFRTAANPQIIKQYAAGNFNASKQLLLQSTKYSFYLMFLLGLPVTLLAKPLLQLWLGQVPEYSVIFLQLIIVQSLFSVFDTSFYTALYAKGRLRENALISPLTGFIQFPVVYILFRLGYSPVVLSYAGIIVYAVLGVVIKPILLCKIANYTFREIMSIFVSCFKVVAVSIWVPLLCAWIVKDEVLNFVFVCVSSVISVGICVFYLGMSVETKNKIRNYGFNVLKSIVQKNENSDIDSTF